MRKFSMISAALGLALGVAMSAPASAALVTCAGAPASYVYTGAVGTPGATDCQIMQGQSNDQPPSVVNTLGGFFGITTWSRAGTSITGFLLDNPGGLAGNWVTPFDGVNFAALAGKPPKANSHLSIYVSQIPLPAGIFLLLSALGGLGFFGWRRKAITSVWV